MINNSLKHKKQIGRGRPAKSDNVVEKNSIRKAAEENITTTELILKLNISPYNLPDINYNTIDIANYSNLSHFNQDFFVEEIRSHNYSDNLISDDALNKKSIELVNLIKEKDLIIKKLTNQLNKSVMGAVVNEIGTHNNITNNETIVREIDVEFIYKLNDGDPLLNRDKYNLACWWCTEQFSNLPYVIPEKYHNNKYYVYGCFCSYNCVVAYNININDYKIWDRYCLIKKMYHKQLHTHNKPINALNNISMAPPRESLKKFGGPLSIEEFRNIDEDSKRSIRIIYPPMVPITPLVEINYDVSNVSIKKKNNDTGLVLKRSKPLPNIPNTIIDTFNGYNKFN